MAKTAVITGSSRGIGKEIAVAFAKKGYNVVINSRNSRGEGKMVADKCASLGARSIYVCADISTEEGAKKLIEAAVGVFGQIDVLVNNAGVTQKKLFVDCTEKDVETVLYGNIASCVFPSIEAIKVMKDYGGSIVNISSMQAKTKSSSEALYGASKAAINGLTRALAAEYGPSGIRVNSVCPGFVETDMTKNYSDEEKEDFRDMTPLGRLGSVKDVAGLVVFLASDKASFITGECIGVDGGVTIS